jgi:hypothetical protein
MRLFLESLGLNPDDPLFRTAIKQGDIYELIELISDSAGDGDDTDPLDGVFTQSDFRTAAQEAQFDRKMIEDILDIDIIRRLEKG